MDFDWREARRSLGFFWCVRLWLKLRFYSLLKAAGASDRVALLPGRLLFPADS